MKGRIIKILIQYPKWMLSIALLLLIGMAAFVQKPETSGQFTGFSTEDSEYYKTAVEITNKFGSMRFIQMSIHPKKTSANEVFESLELIEEDLLEQYPNSKVNSIHQPNLYINTSSNTSIQDVLKKSAEVPILEKLISTDKSAFLMVLFVDEKDEVDVDLLAALLDKKHQGIESISCFSPFHVEHVIVEAINKDLKVLTLIIISFFTLFLLFIYRSFSAVAFAMILIGISLFPALFLFSVLGLPLNLITVLVLPVILVLALADVIHLLTGLSNEDTSKPYNEKLQSLFNKYLTPSFITSLTTSVAFFSFLLNDADNIQNFGLITAINVLISFLLTYLTAPFLLKFVKIKSTKSSRLTGLTSFLLAKRKPFSFVLGVIFIISVFFIPKLQFNMDSRAFIPNNTDVSEDRLDIKNNYYSYTSIELLVQGSAGSVKMKETVIDLHNKIRELPEVSAVTSIKDQDDFKKQFGSLSGLVRFSRKNNPYVTQNLDAYRIDIRVEEVYSIKRVEQAILKLLDENAYQEEIKITSSSLLMDEVNTKVATSLFRSLLFSGIFIILLIFMMTKSIFSTVVSIAANVVPLSFIALIFYLFSLDLNLLTAITSVVCMGLIVDDTIHVLYRSEVLKKDLNELGFGILTTSMILFGGFMSFAFSSFKPSQIFGVVSAVIFIVTVICDLTLLPYLLSFKTKKD